MLEGSWRAHSGDLLMSAKIITAINSLKTAKPYTPAKAPALTGVFYCFNGLTNPTNKPSIPGTIERSKY